MKTLIVIQLLIWFLLLIGCKNNSYHTNDESIYNDIINSYLDSNRYFFITNSPPLDSIRFLDKMEILAGLIIGDSLQEYVSSEKAIDVSKNFFTCGHLEKKLLNHRVLKIYKPYVLKSYEECNDESICVLLTLSRICVNQDSTEAFFISELNRDGDFGRIDRVFIQRTNDVWSIINIENLTVF